mmetsp:Transcript_5241/g.16824  ORF Transcript_5241/g.16824 Transcript_5241/m.16824 type:complete len:172 (-) Transcript_5241:105-620(-)
MEPEPRDSESGAGASSSDGLPRAAVAKLVKERLPPHLRTKPDVAALLSEMAGEFLQMLTSEANEAASAEKKKTLSEAHLLGALRKLGYPQLAAECEAVGEAEHGAQAAAKARKRKLKGAASTLSTEELLAEQQRLFAGARERLQAGGGEPPGAAAPKGAPDGGRSSGGPPA